LAIYDLWQYSQKLHSKSVLKLVTSHLRVTIRLMQHCAAISATAKFLF